MEFKKLIIDNFLSYAHAEVALDTSGLVGIVGVVSGGCSDSNGAGKSALFDALVWCLFGTPVRSKTLDEGNVAAGAIIRNGQKSCSVTTLLSVGTQKIEICRERKVRGGSILSLLINGSSACERSSVSETQKKINQILGIDYKTFLRTVMFGQGITKKFLYATNTEKKAYFERILGLEKLQDARRLVKVRADVLREEIAKMDRELSSVNLSIEHTNMDINTLKNRLDEKSILADQEFSGIEQEIKSKKLQIDAHIVDDACAISADIQCVEDALQGVRNNKVSVCVALDAEIEKYQQAQRAIANAVFSLEKDSNKYASQLDRIVQNDLIGVECAECGRLIDRDTQASHITKLRDTLVMCQRSIDSERVRLKVINTALDTAKANKQAFKTSHASECTDLTDRLTYLKGLILKVDTQIAVKAGLDRDLSNLCLKLESAKKRALDNTFMDMLKDKERQILELSKQVSKLHFKIDMSNDDLRYYSVLYDVFKDMQAYMLDCIVPFLNNRAQHYAQQLTNGLFTVTFDTQKLVAGVLKDNFDVCATIRDGVKDYSLMSGGERQRVNVIVALCLQDLLASRTNDNDVNLRIFDEPFEGMDAGGKDMLLQLMLVEARDKTVFFVTHSSDYQGYFKELVSVRKECEVSHITVE